MTSIAPSVALIIAAYNAAPTIARAVSSALAQSEAAEVIVVDDASTDDTVNCARAADDGSGRLNIISMPQNVGPSTARNQALRECSAPWVGVLDSDDFLLPGRLQGLLHFADQADLIADDMWRVDESNINGERRALLGEFLPQPRSVSFRDFVLSNVTDRRQPRGELGFIKPLMRRAFLESHHLRYRQEMRLGEDYELYARALAFGAKLLLVPAQGYVSVVRANSLSGRHSETDLRHLRDCDATLSALPGLNEADRQALRRHYLSIDCRLQWRLLINAVKQRSMKQAIATFLRPPAVSLYLLRQLCEQLVIRTAHRLKP